MEIGAAQLRFHPSVYDPWSEVEIVRPLGAIYGIGDNTLLPGRVVAEVEPAAFARYSLMKRDVFDLEL
jgi:hypothetical protein